MSEYESSNLDSVPANGIEKETLEQSEKRKEAILRGLAKFGVFAEIEGSKIFDIEKIKNWSSKNEINIPGGKANQMDMIYALSRERGLSKSELGDSLKEVPSERPVIVLPKDIRDMTSSESNGYGERNKEVLLEPWQFGQKQKSWGKPIKLSSGETTNLAEMAIVASLYKFQAHRDEQGKLTLVNPKTNERRSFSASLLKEFTHFDPQVTEQGKIYGWDHNPLEFSKKFLPNLFKAGTLDEADFRTQTGSAAAEKYGEHERPWLKPKAANYAGFSNSEGQFARYYLGRTEIGSTGIIIEPNMRPVALGPDMVGIVKDNGKGREVEAIFPLSTSAELFPLYEEAKKSFNGVKLTASEISQKIVVKKSEMKQKIRRYSATEFLPPRPGEDPVEYYKRLKPLDDPDFILSKVKKVFNGSDKGIHRLRWGEQLILARTLLEGLDEQRLSNFSKTYGLKGVRTFVSLDHGLKMGHDILEMGENLEPALAKAIFEKYSEIVDVSYKAQEYILNHIESEPGSGNESAIKIREQLLGKAKDFLIQMSNASKEKGAGLKSVQLLERLEGVKSEVLLFAATCRNLPPDSKVTLKELLEQRVEDKDSGQLSQEEKKEMQQIFKNNRSGGYPEKLFAETLSDFSKTINEPGHTFRILKENGQVVAFLHYDQVDAETIYVGSLNLHPSAKGEGPIATGMIKAALEENKDKNLTAVVWKNNPAAAFYIRALGFKNRGEIPDYHGTGETYIKLERPKQVAEVSELPKAA